MLLAMAGGETKGWMGGSMKFGVRGTLRDMGQVLEDGYNASLNTFVIGNPGEGALSAYPRATHRYSALEFTLARTRSEERRVGKECLLECRSRWSPYH